MAQENLRTIPRRPEISSEGDLTIWQQLWQRLIEFNTIFDKRFEDLSRETWFSTIYRDLSAGLIVALTAIPMAMGFAIAAGLRPEQGIVAGALACIIGRTWGGSKYQVYGPTAAFIPVILALMTKYGHPATGGSFAQGHGLLVFCSVVSGIILMVMGIFGLGKYVKRVPNSIVVGFSVGIAVVIGLSNIGEVLGLEHAIRGEFFEKIRLIGTHINEFNGYAFFLAMLTFVMTRTLLKISIFIPAPLLALGLGTLLSETIFANKGIADVALKYGAIPQNYFVFTPPSLPPFTMQLGVDIAYFVLAIVFVSSVESLLCSSMADRLANNKKTPFNPDKELWGQGLVQMIVPLINGFPCTGALARTATSIKAGAMTPMAGYFKGILKIALALYLAPWLEMVPMACIGGILLWVATNMIKPAEIKEVLTEGRFHTFLMIYTAIMVPLTDFLTGVLSALVIYGVGSLVINKRQANAYRSAQASVEAAMSTREEQRSAK